MPTSASIGAPSSLDQGRRTGLLRVQPCGADDGLDQVLQITDQHQKAAVSGQSDFFGLATDAGDSAATAPLIVDYATGVRE